MNASANRPKLSIPATAFDFKIMKKFLKTRNKRGRNLILWKSIRFHENLQTYKRPAFCDELCGTCLSTCSTDIRLKKEQKFRLRLEHVPCTLIFFQKNFLEI